MSGRDEAITIKVDNYEKIWYRHWCVNHARGNMTTVLRALVQYIIKYKPTWAQVEHALYTLKPSPAGNAIAATIAEAQDECLALDEANLRLSNQEGMRNG